MSRHIKTGERKEEKKGTRQYDLKPNITRAKLVWDLQLTDDQWETQACVYKLYYGDIYLIVKAGNTLSGSLYLIEKEYRMFVSHDYEKAEDKAARYFKFHKYIKDHPGKKWVIEIVLEDQSMYRLLMKEQELLNKHWVDNNCANRDPEAYIPKKNVNKGQISAFKRYSKNL